jgi:hypothetical protein
MATIANQTSLAPSTSRSFIEIRRVANGYMAGSIQGYSSVDQVYVFETFAGLMAFLKKELPLAARD